MLLACTGHNHFGAKTLVLGHWIEQKSKTGLIKQDPRTCGVTEFVSVLLDLGWSQPFLEN